MATNRPKKKPMRTCCACGRQDVKGELLRIVRRSDGIVKLDPSGREPGRGAYVCPDVACLEKAIAQHRLEKALRITVRPQDCDGLRRDFLEHLGAVPAGEGEEKING
ncbi:MAG: RNase P modulator RnpM [Coriobacteriales bacterium]